MRRCPNCQRENPSEAGFCMNCGTALPKSCAQCGTPLVAGARFCGHCGHANPAAPPDGATRPANPPAPPESARAAQTESERKVVTCLFADVVGSTALAEKMDPEEWTAIMNRAFERMSPAIERYEGTIARLLGDALLAFFGAPVTHEDDAPRAIRAALELLDAAREYSLEVRRDYDIDFQIGAAMML